MPNWTKWLWGGLGWAMFGPIGGIMGYAMGALSENAQGFHSGYKNIDGNFSTQAGDFGAAMLILFAAVMKADNKLTKMELDFVKQFFVPLSLLLDDVLLRALCQYHEATLRKKVVLF